MKIFSSRLRLTGPLYTTLSVLVTVFAVAGVVWASGGEGGEHHASKMVDFGWRMLNFVVLAFLLVKFLGGKIKGFFSGRRIDIKTSIEGAAVAREDAEKKFKEYSERLAKATEEIGSISKMIKAQGEAEKEKIIESAKVSAAKMKEDAQTRMDQDLKAARSALRTEAAELSVKMAEDALTKIIKEEDHDAMVKEFLDRMVQKN